MFSAISFGVRCRDAPSTSAIIRSTKVSPGLLVIRTTIRSDRTVVPPVTAERSPPDSRITGADSPVMADSSTLAIPSTTSPSPGMTWPATTTTVSPGRNDEADTSRPSGRCATVVVRALRSVAACALPRPSATASARSANSTVSHSHAAISQPNRLGSPTARTVENTDPIQTTKITGWWTCVRGSSFFSESSSTGRTWSAGSRERSERAGGPDRLVTVSEPFGERSQRQRREVGEADDHEDDGDEQSHEQRPVGGEGPLVGGRPPLGGQPAREGEDEDDRQEPAEHHRQTERDVVERRVRRQPGEGRAVVVGRGGEGVQHLGEPVRPGVEDARPPAADRQGDAGADQHARRGGEDVEGGEGHLPATQFLAEVLRRASHHQPGDEHGDDGEDEHPVEA